MNAVDFLALPTAGTIYTVADLEREPVRFNSNLGHYTNFVNFFSLCGLALPFGFRPDGLPFGVTLIGDFHRDQELLAFGARWQRAVPLPLGKTTSTLPPPGADPTAAPHQRVSIAVVGAHMNGLALNGELIERSGRLERATQTAPHYRLYALPGGPPHRPGLVRVAEGGAAIDLEVWSLSAGSFGSFVAGIPAPLGIGTITLADGSTVQGFVCEGYATAAARDITGFGGWRAYLKSLS
jgi:allophanate hydrolase